MLSPLNFKYHFGRILVLVVCESNPGLELGTYFPLKDKPQPRTGFLSVSFTARILSYLKYVSIVVTQYLLAVRIVYISGHYSL